MNFITELTTVWLLSYMHMHIPAKHWCCAIRLYNLGNHQEENRCLQLLPLIAQKNSLLGPSSSTAGSLITETVLCSGDKHNHLGGIVSSGFGYKQWTYNISICIYSEQLFVLNLKVSQHQVCTKLHVFSVVTRGKDHTTCLTKFSWFCFFSLQCTNN